MRENPGATRRSEATSSRLQQREYRPLALASHHALSAALAAYIAITIYDRHTALVQAQEAARLSLALAERLAAQP